MPGEHVTLSSVSVPARRRRVEAAVLAIEAEAR